MTQGRPTSSPRIKENGRDAKQIIIGGNDGVFATFLTSFLVLLALALLTSYALFDDSYAHFCTTVETVRSGNFRKLCTDVWDKPIPTLLYGVSGQLGLNAARVVACLVSVLAALFSYLAVRPASSRHVLPALTLAAFFLCQPAVLPQAYVTMTEIPAALCLAAGLYMVRRSMLGPAFLLFGLMPLARLESIVIVVWLFGALSVWYLGQTGRSVRSFLRLLRWGAVGAFPFFSWWLAGFCFTHNVSWFSTSYVYLRPFKLGPFLGLNAITGLPEVLSPPLLFLFVFGLLGVSSTIRKYPSLLAVSILSGGTLVVHLVFLSVVVVYPAGSGWGDQAVAATNIRNYIPVAPAFFVFIAQGAMRLTGWFGGRGVARRLVLPAMLSAALVAGCVPFTRMAFGLKPVLATMFLAVSEATLIAFLLLLWINLRRSRNNDDCVENSRALVQVAAFCIVCLPLSNPIFWYPLRMHDNKAVAQRSFCEWFKSEHRGKAPLIVQDLNGRLDFFCGIRGIPASWQYPHFFENLLAKAPVGSLALIETGPDNKPMGRYPVELIRLLTGSGAYDRVGGKLSPPKFGLLDRLVARLTPRNTPCGWIAYEKRH